MDYLLTNAVTTLLLFFTVKVISQSPATLQLKLLLLALITWFIPWHKLTLLTTPIPSLLPADFESFTPKLNEIFTPYKTDIYFSLNPIKEQTFIEQVQHSLYTANFNIIFITLIGVGLAWFFLDVMRYLIYLKQINNRATLANHILQQHNLSSALCFNRQLNLKVSPDAPTAMATGTLFPTIWINSQTLKSPQLNSILLHELTHLKQFDPTLKWLIQLAKRVFWWNPLVHLLIKKIDLLIEMRCDQHCFTVKQEQYRIDLAEIILKHNKPNQPAIVYASGFTSIHSQTSQNMVRLQSLSIPKKMNEKFVGVAISGLLLSALVCAQINSPLLNNKVTKAKTLHEIAVDMQAHRAKQKKFLVYLADTPENAAYNHEVGKLVSLSKEALNPDKAVLNSMYNQIVEWSNQRPKLPPKQENFLQFHTFAVQNFLLQQQHKHAQIANLVIDIFGSFESLPRIYRHRAISALIQQYDFEQALVVLNQINLSNPRTAIADIYLAVRLYMLLGDYQRATQFIDSRLNLGNDQNFVRLLTLKYQVLNYLGSTEAEQIKQTLADDFNKLKIPSVDFSKPKKRRMHWAPVLDYI